MAAGRGREGKTLLCPSRDSGTALPSAGPRHAPPSSGREVERERGSTRRYAPSSTAHSPSPEDGITGLDPESSVRTVQASGLLTPAVLASQAGGSGRPALSLPWLAQGGGKPGPAGGQLSGSPRPRRGALSLMTLEGKRGHLPGFFPKLPVFPAVPEPLKQTEGLIGTRQSFSHAT